MDIFSEKFCSWLVDNFEPRTSYLIVFVLSYTVGYIIAVLIMLGVYSIIDLFK